MKKKYYSPAISPVPVQTEESFLLLADSGTVATSIAPINATVTDFVIDTDFQTSGFKDAPFGDGEISFM